MSPGSGSRSIETSHAWVWIATPFTGLVDVPIPIVNGMIFYGYWFGYYPFFGR